MSMGQSYLASSAMLVVMFYTSPALAQPSAAPAPVAPPADAAATDRQSSDSGEIVVTAQRRTELARDVPISLTALSGDQLQRAGIPDPQSLQHLTPGLTKHEQAC